MTQSPQSELLAADKAVKELVKTIQQEVATTRQQIMDTLKAQTKRTYWTIGKHIKDYLTTQSDPTHYGQRLIPHLATQLGIAETVLYQSMRFYDRYPNILNARSELSWSHIRTLLTLPDTKTQDLFESKVIEESLSTRELKQAIKDHTNTPHKSPQRTEKAASTSPLSLTRETPYIYKYKTIQGKQMVDLGFRIYIDQPNRPVSVGDVTHYTYKAIVTQVIDGDTVWVDIDLGFDTWTSKKVRLRGIDTPPVKSTEGLQAKKFVEDALRGLPFIAVRTYWRDKFNRYLVDVFYGDSGMGFEEVCAEGVFLNQGILDAGVGRRFE